MNTLCNSIQEMMIPYINGELNAQDKYTFLNHLSTCKECREEFVFIRNLQKEMNTLVIEVPLEIKNHIFDKVYMEQEKVEHMSSEIIDLFIKKVPTPVTSLEVIAYCINTVKHTVSSSLKDISLSYSKL